ncbi:MAG TPA: IS66 family insertion sequence element accessory protein TnpB [Polyangiaceae bacterium]|jgi:transposase|nr:IS66 family insertion sequence element accessory protein TnpB [Polyangiaceae bacterium]
MLSVPSQVKIFLCAEATDMRKGFDTLAGVVREALALDPLSGHLFVFRSRRGDRVKLLWWDVDGWALFYKRLEAGKFFFPTACGGQRSVTISATDLAMLLDGVDLASVRRGQRFRRAV